MTMKTHSREDPNETFASLASTIAEADRELLLPALSRLLEEGVDPNLLVASHDRQCTLLSLCRDGAIAQLLVDAGADPHLVTQYGTTPFLDALKSGSMLTIAPMVAKPPHTLSRSFVFDDESWIEMVPFVHRRVCMHLMEALFGSTDDIARAIQWSVSTRPSDYRPRLWPRRRNPFLA
jgi:hypothetical protein